MDSQQNFIRHSKIELQPILHKLVQNIERGGELQTACKKSVLL